MDHGRVRHELDGSGAEVRGGCPPSIHKSGSSERWKWELSSLSPFYSQPSLRKGPPILTPSREPLTDTSGSVALSQVSQNLILLLDH